ncbi:MAG: CinA family nicotinamide mononucleotide deamidase-related protein [Flavobacterium sp.]|nr:CinA family nicotinamide mononucleotide deamidase-related protein [Flavobacterium sp.]
MKAAILTIGDEILIGQIVDTNSSFIAKSLDKIGIEVCEMQSIADDKQAILEAFARFQDRVDLVLITGGLGPTKDDITKHTFCEYFDDELQRNLVVEQHVINLFQQKLKLVASQVNKDQALVPSRCEILHNEFGTAPGMWMRKSKTVFVSLPGVPYEMKAIVANELVPKLVREYQRPYIIHQTILTYGQGESRVAERIEDWENNLPSFIKLAYLPSPGRVRLRLSARGTDKGILKSALQENIAQLNVLIGDIIVGFEEEDTIEVVVGRLLQKQQLTLATAESCTGGKISQVLTAKAGASAYFKGSVVCYSTEVKETVLGIDAQLIQKQGVVSAAVAVQMAENVRQVLKSDFAIATTGNAGPSLGDESAPLGTVFIAIASVQGTVVEEFSFGQPREKVIDRAVNKSLELLQKEILKNLD